MKSMISALAAASALFLGASAAFAADGAPAPAPAPAAEVVGGCAPCAPAPCCPSGWAVWGEALMLKFHPSVADFAANDDNDDGSADGVVHETEFDYDLAFRAGVGYRAPGSRVGVGLQVTYADHDVSQTAQAVAGGAIGLTHEDAGTGVDFVTGGRVAHSSEITYLVLDLGLCYHIGLGSSGSEARLFAGGRFASIEQATDSTIFNAAGAPEKRVLGASDLTGFGLAAGGELRLRFCGGWSVFGRAATGLLLSSIDARATVLDNADPNTVDIDTTNSIDRITPFFEMGVGFGWGTERLCGTCMGLQVDLGFELANWFNVLDPLSFIDDVTDSSLDQESDDLGLSAFSLKVTLTF